MRACVCTFMCTCVCVCMHGIEYVCEYHSTIGWFTALLSISIILRLHYVHTFVIRDNAIFEWMGGL